MIKKVFPLLFAFLFIVPYTRAQIAVDSFAVVSYVQDVLLGGGVEATNISFTGCLNQIGYMSGGASANLGIESGVVLSTEHVKNITVPSPNQLITNNNCVGINNDPDLVTIANSVPPLIGQVFSVAQVKDKSILEFDFIPTGDTLRFNYIFGSDEYLEWVNSSYNDVFAFFLSGPGITGPYASPPGFPGGSVNIAKLPDTNPPLPITVSSVNNLLNSQYYIDNPDNLNISIDGYTVKLEAMHPVQCGQTYHIKLAIADGNDGSLESIVVLEERSFASSAVVDIDFSIDVGPPGSHIMYEDCGLATIVFTRAPNSDINEEDSVVLNWGGTAVMGVDYNSMPQMLVFPPGVESVTYYVDAIADGIIEGPESVHVEILNPAVCGEADLMTSFEFFIADVPDPLEVSGYDTDVCTGNAVELTPIITGGYGTYQYHWNTNESTFSISPTPANTTEYLLTVTDTCGMPPEEAHFHVEVLNFIPLEVHLNNDDLILLSCYDTEVFTATASGGDGDYTFMWTNQNGINLMGDEDTLWYPSGYGEGPVYINLTDGCGTTVVDSSIITLDIPDMIVDIPTSMVVVCNEPFSFDVSVSSGLPPYSYLWSTANAPNWDLQSNHYENPGVNHPVQVQMSVSDDCGQTEIYPVSITIAPVPQIDLALIDTVSGDCLEEFNLQPVIGGGSGGFTYSWFEGSTYLGSSPSLVYSNNESTEVILLVIDACLAVAYDTVEVTIVNPPVNVEIGDDLFASCIEHTQIIPNVTGGTGGYNYSWMVNGEEEGQQVTFAVQSFETVTVSVEVEDACGVTGTDELTLNIPDIPVVLTASPDTSVCYKGIATLIAEASGGEEGFSYDWTPTGTDDPVNVIGGIQSSTVYTVTATDICGRSATTSILVEMIPVSAGFLTTNLSENSYEFIARDEPYCHNCQYYWNLGDGTTSQDIIVEHTFDGVYAYEVQLTAINEIGCIDSSFYTVPIPPSFYIPNSFTPNGDGINDVWAVVSKEVNTFDLRIFNRWGEQVFYSTDPSVPWIGDRQRESGYFVPDGVYTYVIKATGFRQETFEKTGSIVLTR